MTDEPRQRPLWRFAAALAGLCGVIYLLTASYSGASGDVTATDVLSWQLATTGDSTFDASTYPPLDQHPGRFIWVIETPGGREVIGRSPGPVLAGVPAYAVLGRGDFSVAPGAAAAALLTALAVGLLASCIGRLVSRREATLAVLAFALSTPVWTVSANAMWPHTVTVLGVCGMSWALARERWLLVGLFGGVVLWGRLHAAVLVAVLGLLLGLRRRDARITATIGAGSGLLLLLQCAWNRWIYDSWSPLASYDTGPFQDYAGVHRFDLANQLGFWISPDRGLLVWTPVVVLLLPALVRSWKELPDWSTALLLSGVAYTVVQGVLNRFSGGDSFYGYRLTLEALACAVPALTLAARRAGRWAGLLLGPVLAYQAFTILAGAVNEKLGSPAEEVWTTHSFFSALSPQPALIVVFLAICLAAGLLGRRIWRSQPA